MWNKTSLFARAAGSTQNSCRENNSAFLQCQQVFITANTGCNVVEELHQPNDALQGIYNVLVDRIICSQHLTAKCQQRWSHVFTPCALRNGESECGDVGLQNMLNVRFVSLVSVVCSL